MWDRLYSADEKRYIYELRSANVSWKVIGATIQKKPTALRKWWEKNRLIIDLPPKPKIDKSLTSGRVGLQIKKLLECNPQLTIPDIEVELRKVLPPETRIPKRTTISNYLKKNKLVLIKLLRKPLVSDKNKQKRVEFATKYLANLDKLIHETIWSDETTVRKCPKGQDIYFRCHSSVNKENLPTNSQIQQGGFSVMFWGCFSAFGLGPLVALEGNQNQYTYRNTLQTYLLPEIAAAKDEFGIDMTFMQDNAPCHKTNLIKDFFIKNKISSLDWPAQSPDLNPIENLWAIVKKRRQKKFGIPRTKIELIDQIFKIWEEIDENLLGRLSDSIETRLDEIIRFGGKPTKY